MNKKTKLLIPAFAALSVLSLASCKKDGADASTYRTYYTGEFETLNYLKSQSATDHEYTANIVDGLLDTDRFGKLTPTLAKAVPDGVYDAATDTTVFEFEIRDDVNWYTQDGKEYAKVTAQDWITTAEYILNPANGSETAYMWEMFIKGASEWSAAKAITNTFTSATQEVNFGTEAEPKMYTGDKYAQKRGFANYAEAKAMVDAGMLSTVGIKADGQKLTFTVLGNTPYFTTALNYTPFYPSNAQFLQDEGTTFGDDYKNVLYCGAYLISSHANSSEIVMKANPNYYDAANVSIKTIKWTYANAQNTDSTTLTRTLFEANNIDGFAVNQKDEQGWKKYVAGEDGTGTLTSPVNTNTYTATGTSAFVYCSFWNFDRSKTVADHKKYGSTHTAASYANTQKAIANKNFRLAVTHGLDWTEYVKTVYGYGYEWAHKGYTPANLATSSEGKDYTTYFADVYAKKNPVSKDLSQDDAFKYLYPNSDANDQKDVVYSKSVATSYADQAYTELSAQGVTFPVLVEVRGSYSTQQAATLEELFGAVSKDGASAITTSSGVALFDFKLVNPTQENYSAMTNAYAYDFLPLMGWGPDYAYPLTYLNTFVLDGDMVSYLGFTSDNEDLQKSILGEYDSLIQEAKALPTNSKEQYEKFAEAEYNLLYENGAIIPMFNQASTNVYVSKLVPYSRFRGVVGVSNYKYKFGYKADHTITQTEFNALRDAFKTGDADKLQSAINDVVSNKYVK